jgi:hypothetical protein
MRIQPGKLQIVLAGFTVRSSVVAVAVVAAHVGLLVGEVVSVPMSLVRVKVHR